MTPILVLILFFHAIYPAGVATSGAVVAKYPLMPEDVQDAIMFRDTKSMPGVYKWLYADPKKNVNSETATGATLLSTAILAYKYDPAAATQFLKMVLALGPIIRAHPFATPPLRDVLNASRKWATEGERVQHQKFIARIIWLMEKQGAKKPEIVSQLKEWRAEIEGRIRHWQAQQKQNHLADRQRLIDANTPVLQAIEETLGDMRKEISGISIPVKKPEELSDKEFEQLKSNLEQLEQIPDIDKVD